MATRPHLGVRAPLGADERWHVRRYSEHGYTMREIADHLGIHYATVSRRIRGHGSGVVMQR